MQKMEWFQRRFTFGHPIEMLPFFLERLEGTAARIETKVADAEEKILSAKHDGKWSVKQNIGHLSEVDEIASRRVTEMLQGISPMSPAVFEPGMDYNAMPIEQVIDLFKRRRRENISKYSQLTDEELTRSSLHPRLKVNMTPVDLAWFDAEHDDHHLVRISEILHHLRL